MEYVLSSLILSLLFLTATTLIARSLFKALEQVSKEMSKVTSQQTSALKHLANLLATKDPMAFQQVQAVTSLDVPAKSSHEHLGVYLTGDELQLLEEEERKLDALWKQASEDLDD